ncbi:MAG: S8 family serine peptidase [Polyangiaceae bacterium]
MTPAILSLRERLDVHPDYTGRGVNIAFIDSAFFPHPDLTRPTSRIRAFIDLTRDAPAVEDFLAIEAHVWHGTMTACCAAGNGYLSHGRYAGIASNAEVVLLRVQASDRLAIQGHTVAKALRFIKNHPELEVHVVNVSVGVSWDDPDALDVEDAVAEVAATGVVVVAAAGNIDGAPPSPPASSAAAISVGGLDDQNTPASHDDARWPSSSGARSNRVMKPDLLAPAARLPAPMLPGSLTAREASPLFQVLRILEDTESDIRFRKGRDLDPSRRDEASLAKFLDAVRERIRDQKYIAPAYQHVDGTSFSAPIVSSVVAQMLEANPRLTSTEIRRGLVETCRRLPGVPAVQQGAGVLAPRAAVAWAEALAGRGDLRTASRRVSTPPTEARPSRRPKKA